MPQNSRSKASVSVVLAACQRPVFARFRAMGNQPCKCFKDESDLDGLVFSLPVCGGVDAAQADFLGTIEGIID